MSNALLIMYRNKFNVAAVTSITMLDLLPCTPHSTQPSSHLRVLPSTNLLPLLRPRHSERREASARILVKVNTGEIGVHLPRPLIEIALFRAGHESTIPAVASEVEVSIRLALLGWRVDEGFLDRALGHRGAVRLCVADAAVLGVDVDLLATGHVDRHGERLGVLARGEEGVFARRAAGVEGAVGRGVLADPWDFVSRHLWICESEVWMGRLTEVLAVSGDLGEVDRARGARHEDAEVLRAGRRGEGENRGGLHGCGMQDVRKGIGKKLVGVCLEVLLFDDSRQWRNLLPLYIPMAPTESRPPPNRPMLPTS